MIMKQALLISQRGFVAILLLCLPVLAMAQEEQFPYPTVPQELRTVETCAAFITEHYWDNYDFNDTTLIHRPEITEQGFANFIDLLARVDSVIAVSGVAVFSASAFKKSTPANVRAYFADLTEHYLYDPNSPMRSDELYLLFLDRLAVAPTFTAAERERFAFKRTNILKNQVGNVAADFEYVDRKGQKHTLHTTKGEYTLLYLYDPDCEVCHATTAVLSKNTLLTDNPRLTVLAIYPDADTDLWLRRPQSFPASWVDAYSPNGKVAAELYFIRATPTILLLNKDKRVLLKDPSPGVLIQYLTEAMQ